MRNSDGGYLAGHLIVAWATEKIWRWLISRTSNSGPHHPPPIYQQCARLYHLCQVRSSHHSDQMSQGLTSTWRPTPPTNPSPMCKTPPDKDLQPTRQIVDDHPATTSSSFNLNSITERSGLRCCTNSLLGWETSISFERTSWTSRWSSYIST